MHASVYLHDPLRYDKSDTGHHIRSHVKSHLGHTLSLRLAGIDFTISKVFTLLKSHLLRESFVKESVRQSGIFTTRW